MDGRTDGRRDAVTHSPPITTPHPPPLLPVFEHLGLQRGRAARLRSCSFCVEEEEGEGERHGAAVGRAVGFGGPLYPAPPSRRFHFPSRCPGSPPMRCPDGSHPPRSSGMEEGRKDAECCHTARTSRPWVPPSRGQRGHGAGLWGRLGREGSSEDRTRELRVESAALCSPLHLAAVAGGGRACATAAGESWGAVSGGGEPRMRGESGVRQAHAHRAKRAEQLMRSGRGAS